jgi:sarcosine oxidase subunit alpha
MWPLFEKALRNIAGLGRIDIHASLPEGHVKQYLHGDVVVIGAGPAGMGAALAAAEQGASVLLFDENPALGGHIRHSPVEDQHLQISDLQKRVADHPNVSVYLNTTVLGLWEENWLAAIAGRRMYKIRGRAIVFATGSYERPLVFDNNDLPGVMLGSGVQRMLHLYRVIMGQTAVIITANDDGWRVAADLQAAGVTVAAVADERNRSDSSLAGEVAARGSDVFWAHTVVAAEGNSQVSQVVLGPASGVGTSGSGGRATIPCDLVVVSVGWTPANGLLYQSGANIAYDQDRAAFLPQHLPPGIFAAGRVAGTFGLETQLDEGRMSGQLAAAYAGMGTPPSKDEVEGVSRQKAGEDRPSSNLVRIPGRRRRFICFCEDVTDKDLATSIAEGYDSIELLKRYSTISMGPCQGKMCSVNTIHLCARANEWTIKETGTTVTRPPMIPASLASLAGQIMEPVKQTPVHDWHVAQGAKMMVAGLWMRPEHYGDPTNEVMAVREKVGLIDVSTLGKLKFTGPGVPDLLEKIYVNKWQKLAVGRARYGMMCNDEGILVDDGVTAMVGEQEWYTTTTSSGANAIYEWLQWWMQSGWGEGVHLTNVTEDWAAFNLTGPESRALLQQLTADEVSAAVFPYMHVKELTVAGVACRLLRIGFTGELSFEIHCPAAYGRHLWQAIMDVGDQFGISPFGVEAQRVLRLEKAHIIVGQDTDALSDPISADVSWVVKLDKDDFLGQRQLSRVSANGPRQKLVGFKMIDSSIVPEEGLQIVRQDRDAPIGLEIIGWITSSRFSPVLNETIGLCWLPTELADRVGSRFAIRREGQLIEAAVHHGAFYDPEGNRLRM